MESRFDTGAFREIIPGHDLNRIATSGIDDGEIFTDLLVAEIGINPATLIPAVHAAVVETGSDRTDVESELPGSGQRIGLWSEFFTVPPQKSIETGLNPPELLKHQFDIFTAGIVQNSPPFLRGETPFAAGFSPAFRPCVNMTEHHHHRTAVPAPIGGMIKTFA